jgi:hypothetical protein
LAIRPEGGRPAEIGVSISGAEPNLCTNGAAADRAAQMPSRFAHRRWNVSTARSQIPFALVVRRESRASAKRTWRGKVSTHT